MKQNDKKQLTSSQEKKKICAESGVIVAVALLLCYFFGFSYVYNTEYGVEAGVNGWNYIFACFSWTFKSSASIYGDGLAVPFNYYAKYFVRVLSVATTVSFVTILAFTVLTVLNIVKFNKKIEIASMIILYVIAFIFLVCIVTALAMNGSDILPIYCSGNPKCSIATLTFIPFFVSLIAAISHSVFIRKSLPTLDD